MRKGRYWKEWNVRLAVLSIFLLVLSMYSFRRRVRSDERVNDLSTAHLWNEPPALRLLVVGNGGQPLYRLVDSMEKCDFENIVVSLEIHFLEDARWDEAVEKLQWLHGPLRLVRGLNPFESILDAWHTYPGSTERAIFLRENCSVCSCKLSSYLDVFHDHFREDSTIAGMGFSPVPTLDEDALSVSIPPSCGFSPASASVWSTFRTYLLAHRNSWFTWPEKDSSLYGDWMLWWSRFSSDYGLYSFFPHKALIVEADRCPRPTDGEASSLSIRADPIRLTATYERESPSSSSSSSVIVVDDAKVDLLVQYGREQGGFVSVTIVNKAFLTTAHSWLCNVREMDIEPPGIVWIATDQQSFDELSKVAGTKALLFGMQGGKNTGNEYGQPGYWQLMLERTLLFLKVLQHGVAVFAFETDQIWLRDPLPYIHELVHDGADVVGTMDSRNEIGGNFLYLQPSIPFVKLYSEVYHRFLRYYVAEGLASKARDSYTYIPNDQSQLTSLVLYDVEFRFKFPVVFRALNTEIFVDGRWYENRYQSTESKHPVLINNNFLVGVDKKIKRAKKVGHWFYDEHTHNCIPEVARRLKDQTPKSSKTTEDLHQHIVFPPKDNICHLTKCRF